MNFLCLLPIVGAGFAVLSFCTSYIVAVARGDVYPWWPYISDTGTTVPESCIFGELLTLSAIFALVAMVVRYKWIQSFNPEDKKLGKLNIVALVIGCISCFAMTMVANFQETSVQPVHLSSAIAAFGFGVAYNFIHSEITRRMSPRYSSVCMWILRLSLSMLGFISFGLLYGFGLSANSRGKHWYGNDSRKKLDWNPQDPGWGMHLVASVSEWIIGLSIILYFLTYSVEFGKIKLRIQSEVVAPIVNDDADDSPMLT